MAKSLRALLVSLRDDRSQLICQAVYDEVKDAVESQVRCGPASGRVSSLAGSVERLIVRRASQIAAGDTNAETTITWNDGSVTSLNAWREAFAVDLRGPIQYPGALRIVHGVAELFEAAVAFYDSANAASLGLRLAGQTAKRQGWARALRHVDRGALLDALNWRVAEREADNALQRWKHEHARHEVDDSSVWSPGEAASRTLPMGFVLVA